MILDIKQNINKIDSDLKELFENVYITEKTNKGNYYFNITANKMFLFEGCKKRIEVNIDINKNDLNTTIVKWNYSVNPLNENADKIERVSYIQNLANDIYDIASNKRMVKEYFASLEEHVDLINEGDVNLREDVNMFMSISNILRKYSNSYDKIIGNVDKGKGYYIATSKEEISMANKFNLEKDLLEIGVNFISFNGKDVKITL